jgi:arabinan endo-1,5-alpha-L-arabinosidase
MLRKAIARQVYAGFALILGAAACENENVAAPDAGLADGSVSSDAVSEGAADATQLVDAGSPDTSTVIDAGADVVEGGPADGATDAGGASCGDSFGGGPIDTTTTYQSIPVHDPSMIWDGQDYFLFATGGTLQIRTSPDILNWSSIGNVFKKVPAWVTTYLGATPSALWAPDISYFNGSFHLYYAGSTFGSNQSVIGLATSPTLQATDPSYGWTDQGLVVSSASTDNFNAIDPNVAFDDNCNPWLAFGSFWSGIKMRRLDPTTGMPSSSDTTLYSLASRNGGAIEAASIVRHNGYYYLFVSFDACCQGVNSTYRTMMGRAPAITGPYTDKSGTSMMSGAAEQLLTTSGRYIGPGGGTAWRDGNTYLYAYHYYDGDDGGASKLQIRPIVFGSDDWVTLGDPLFP